MKQGDGWIAVDSKPGRGATFKIHWPRLNDGPPPPQQNTTAAAETPRGMETVLVLEDQPDVRRLIKAILGEYGYQILEAVDGAKAVRIAGEYSGAIHLLLADVVLPGMNGREAAEAIVKLRPDIGVLFISGYTADVINRRGIIDPDVAYRPKPFAPAALAAKVREVLDADYRKSPSNPCAPS